MLLAVDVGNTQTVLGLLEEEPGDASEGLLAHWRLETNAAHTSDELFLLVHQLLALSGKEAATEVGGVAISSTVPRVRSAWEEMARSHLDAPTVVVGPGLDTGMAVAYHRPEDVGADRIANAVAVRDRYGSPAIVVDFGTATTFDAIAADGAYLGGAIVPGVEVSLEALFARASLLGRVELTEPVAAIGRSTAEAIRSGTIFGFAAQADGLCRRFLDELGPARVVATGGLGGLIAPHCRVIETYDPWLTLHGLRILFRRNAGRAS